MSNLFIIFFTFLNLSCYLYAQKLWVHRNPRFLPFPMGVGNKLQIITGFGIPVDLKDSDVTFGLIMKTNYELPTNSAQFTRPEEAFEGVDVKMTRWSFYSLIKSVLDRLSFDGHNCVLKSICQAAGIAFEQNGLLGEILEVLFLPSSTSDSTPMVLNEFEHAEMVGREAPNEDRCDEIFPNCSTSIIDIITTLENNGVENVLFKNIR